MQENNVQHICFETLRECFYEVFKLAIFDEMDGSKINNLKDYERKDFISYCLQKKAGQLLGYAVNKKLIDLGDKYNAYLIKQYLNAVSRYAMSEHAVEVISKAFSDNHIKHSFLKGPTTRKLYPQPWMRVSNDLDILVSPEDLAKAEDVLKNQLQGKFFTRCEHHVCYIVESLHLNIELHHIINAHFPEDLKYILQDALSRGKPLDNEYHVQLTETDTMMFIISHLAKHINGGEFWITMLLDVYYLMKLTSIDKEKISEARLDILYNTLKDLIDSILENKELTKEEKYFEELIFKNSNETLATVRKGKYSSTFSLMWHRIFISRKILYRLYPSVEKCKILLPFGYIRRFFSLLSRSKEKSKELQDFKKQQTSNEEQDALRSVGLKEYIEK